MRIRDGLESECARSRSRVGRDSGSICSLEVEKG